MSRQHWYRRMEYLTLALSCACLVLGETILFPGMELCLPPLMLLILLAYRVEGRWVLPIWGANVLGLMILAGTILWVGLELTDDESWISHIPKPAAFIPLTGPVILALLVVKLFRPRSASDFWLLQGVGLVQVGLGCLITGDTPFALLLGGYFFSGLATLVLHYYSSPSAVGDRVGAGRLLLIALRSFLVIAPLSLLVFLLTPRLGKSTWKPVGRYRGRGAMTTVQPGMLNEIDLNHTGAIVLDEGVALTFTATDAQGNPVLNPGADPHWRAAVLEHYAGGMWRSELHRPPTQPVQKELPDFGPDTRFIDFTIRPREAGGLVLAEPICLGPPGRHLPVVAEQPLQEQPLFGEIYGTVLPGVYNRRREYRYRQAIPGPSAGETAPFAPVNDRYVQMLTVQQVSGLRQWTLALLGRLARQPRYALSGVELPAADSEQRLAPEHWEVVARALSDYLANSGDYTYTLELRRSDPSLDPAMDFLVNVREGHCSRYASAQALMLRALGIPARIVVGYRGAERQGEGVYLIRRSQAHSWVEALVPRQPGSSERKWISLDPTPGAEANRRASFSLSRWWNSTRDTAEFFWREMVVNYNAENQADLWDTLLSKGPGPLLLLLLAVGGACLGLVLFVLRLPWRLRRRRLRRHGGRAAVLFYQRLLRLLDRRLGLRPRPAQTAHELALAARDRLRQLPVAPPLVDLPDRIVERFYGLRFGGQVLSDQEEHQMEQELDELDQALGEGSGVRGQGSAKRD